MFGKKDLENLSDRITPNQFKEILEKFIDRIENIEDYIEEEKIQKLKNKIEKKYKVRISWELRPYGKYEFIIIIINCKNVEVLKRYLGKSKPNNEKTIKVDYLENNCEKDLCYELKQLELKGVTNE